MPLKIRELFFYCMSTRVLRLCFCWRVFSKTKNDMYRNNSRNFISLWQYDIILQRETWALTFREFHVLSDKKARPLGYLTTIYLKVLSEVKVSQNNFIKKALQQVMKNVVFYNTIYSLSKKLTKKYLRQLMLRVFSYIFWI